MVTSCSQNREVWFGDNGKQLSVPKNKTEKNVSVAGLIFFICLFILCLCVCVTPPRGALLNEGYWTHMHIQNGTHLTASQGALSITAVFDPGGKHWFFFFPHFQDYMIHFEVNFYISVFLFCLKKKEQRMMSYWHYMQIQPSCQYSSIFTAFTHTYDSFPKPG